jgi:hypothetical protein
LSNERFSNMITTTWSMALLRSGRGMTRPYVSGGQPGYIPLSGPPAVAEATVAAAVLFNLPRRCLQRAVNRRFRRPA